MPLWQRRQITFWAGLGSVASRLMREGDPSSLSSSGEAASGELSSLLVSSVQDRHGATGESSSKGYTDAEETGAPLL